jgi:hypothetical protein
VFGVSPPNTTECCPINPDGLSTIEFTVTTLSVKLPAVVEKPTIEFDNISVFHVIVIEDGVGDEVATAEMTGSLA